MVTTSAFKEKLVVLVGSIGTGITGYLAASGYPLEATLAGTIAAAIIAFWSEGINTGGASNT